MRHRFNFTAATLAVGAVCASGCAAEISLQVRPGHAIATVDQQQGPLFDTSAVQTMRIFLADRTGEQNDFLVPVDRDQQSRLPSLAVTKSEPFAIDVWGCSTLDACAAADVLFRGCVAVNLKEVNTTQTVPVPVDMLPTNDTRLTCPIVIK